MPPKSRKSVSAWNVCERCKVVVSQKDLNVHIDNSCPPAASSWIHGYIKDGIMYGVLEEVNFQGNLSEIYDFIFFQKLLVYYGIIIF